VRRPPLFLAIFGLVLATLLVAQLVSILLLALVRPPPPAALSVEGVAARILEGATDPSLRARSGRITPRFDPGDGPTAPRIAALLARAVGVPEKDVVVDLARMQRGRFILVEVERHGAPQMETALVGDFTVSIRQPDGSWRHFAPVGEAIFDRVEQRYIVLFVAGALIMLPFAWWLARALARPFDQFADAAERLGRDPSADVPPVEGPREVTRAGEALGTMARQLHAWVTDRTQMVGALAHDLRTPLTRLSFRIEQVPPELRNPIAADIAEMEQMVAQTLDYVRGVATPAARERLELLSLVEQVADEQALTGRAVTVEGETSAIVDGDPVALRRLFTNLLENAVHYGRRARAFVEPATDRVVVRIEDDGPGLPESELPRVIEPFYRAEPSRNRKTGGMGLGLSIARSITLAHGGELRLANRPGGGLSVTVDLPLAPRPADDQATRQNQSEPGLRAA
jgi:signal transduction histidine kinase